MYSALRKMPPSALFSVPASLPPFLPSSPLLSHSVSTGGRVWEDRNGFLSDRGRPRSLPRPEEGRKRGGRRRRRMIMAAAAGRDCQRSHFLSLTCHLSCGERSAQKNAAVKSHRFEKKKTNPKKPRMFLCFLSECFLHHYGLAIYF